MSEPDYLNIEIPSDKNPSDFSYAERRAEEIEYVRRYGDPALVPKTKLAERYDVTLSQICQDFDRILDYLEDYGADETARRVKVFLNNLFDDIVKEKKFVKDQNGRMVPKDLGQEELRELYDFVRLHADWMMALGSIERESTKLEHEGDFSIEINKEIVGGEEEDGD